MTPSLEDIQTAINRCSRSILAASKEIPSWTPVSSDAETSAGGETDSGGRRLFDDIACDKEIVKTVLLLTGSVEGAKRQVWEYLSGFSRYEWLWKADKTAAYAEFMAKKRSFDDFEAELRKYVEVEMDVQKIAPVHNIGALSLETTPLKHSLKAEAAAWKSQYTQNLHVQAKAELERLIGWMDEMGVKLKREVTDLDTVRNAMGYLKQIRDKEGVIEQEFAPIEEMYAMLARCRAHEFYSCNTNGG
eukprot:6184516-Pleurochrysis_carterae.AAC.1